MRVGYPCINWTIGCKGDRTFRLNSFQEARFVMTVANNLDCLAQMLAYNVNQRLLFFRISSNLIPFASHPVCNLDWKHIFAEQFQKIGAFIKSRHIRISMHPGQFTVLNSPHPKVFQNSLSELEYHVQVLDALDLDPTAKIQIHIGGVYGDKSASMQRFCERFRQLDAALQRRLVIENDDQNFNVDDGLAIYQAVGIPILFDAFHHSVLPGNLDLSTALARTAQTWAMTDGIPMVDYSSQAPHQSVGKHCQSIDLDDFAHFLRQTTPIDFDVMLEIKDKEQSALHALTILTQEPRFQRVFFKG